MNGFKLIIQSMSRAVKQTTGWTACRTQNLTIKHQNRMKLRIFIGDYGIFSGGNFHRIRRNDNVGTL